MADDVSEIDNKIFGYIGNVYAHGCMCKSILDKKNNLVIRPELIGFLGCCRVKFMILG